MRRSYSELQKLKTFEERYEYLKLSGHVGVDTFGFDRYLNQRFYKSKEWKDVRNSVILRDNGCDLGVKDQPIRGKIYVHHMNPMSVEDIETLNEQILNPDNLICVSHDTHNAIHYGDKSLLPSYEYVERKPNDTCPWIK